MRGYMGVRSLDPRRPGEVLFKKFAAVYDMQVQNEEQFVARTFA